ncbi:hypothetical protein SPRG_00752 [Saprolegnia parasitica CBS 223.65]|uniref:Uncharacterized protein n=1 Tax=Saprolegnia parasitica (strain CBS 223.65) TaxID=695850 RepID=A0A067CW44_SAPPC|nr:hypothetical protein SPRG_00752 [Saprolegnia parasitica CBS 223.65]KDO34688.1 hypothetical protein SPRG_00752 [Saprolegnia parasitica CBS 223.65]|eukprot:XP_012194360.1 hypothetical protein SPRG_00752 [Saprolegnia parasitica CBS 223.65]
MTSNSPLRRVLSTPKMPHLSPDCALSDRPETPLVEVPRATTVPLVAVRQWAPDECHPRTAIGNKRQLAEPHTKSTPTLGAYKAAPLFVEPIALAARMHLPMEATAKRPRSKPTKSMVSRPSVAPSDVPKESISPPKHKPTSLLEHHAAMTLQRYFRRNLLTPSQVQTATRTQPRDVDNSAALSAAYEAREAETAHLRTIQVHYCTGLSHQEAGEWELAEESYALALDVPTSASFATIRVNLASACLSQGKFADAQRILSSAVAIAPTCVPALYNHGLADWHMGDLHAAATKFTKVLTLAPSHGKAIYALHVLKSKFDTVIHD